MFYLKDIILFRIQHLHHSAPILNLILRGRGFTDSEISYINLVIPFLIFFTNPLFGYFADRDRRFRLTFNITLGLATILFVIMFFLTFDQIQPYSR